MKVPALILIFAFALAGCMGDVCKVPPQSARLVSDAPSEGGYGGNQLNITVSLGLEGELLSGAGVVVFWPVDGDIIQLEADPFFGIPGGMEYENVTEIQTIRLQTDNGYAVANVPDVDHIFVTAAAKNLTEEWVYYIPVEANMKVHIPLYPLQLEWELTETWDGATASLSYVTGQAPQWDPHEVVFMAPADQENIMSRVQSMELSLEWTNTPTAFSDFGLAIGSNSIGKFQDSQTTVAPGTYNEVMTVSNSEIIEYGIGNQWLVGPATDEALFAPLGLPYTVAITADLDFYTAASAECGTIFAGADEQQATQGNPGKDSPAAWLPVIAVGLLLLAWKRR